LFQKLIKIVSITLLIYAVIGFFLLPLFIKPQLTTLIAQESYAKLSMQKVLINPFTFRVDFIDVILNDREEQRVLSFDSLSIDLNPTSLLFGMVEVKEIVFKNPKLNIVYRDDKRLNLLSLVKQKTPELREEERVSVLPHIVLDTISIAGGELAFSDYTHRDVFKFDFENINVSLLGIDTADMQESRATVALKTTLKSGGYIALQTSLKSLNPLISQGSIDIAIAKLPALWEYVKENFNYKIAEGSLKSSAQYSINLDDLNATEIKNIDVELHNLQLKAEKKQHTFVALKKLKLSQAEFSPFTSTFSVGKLSLDGLHVDAQRDTNGIINLEKYFFKERKNGKEKESKDDTKSVNFHMNTFEVFDSTISFVDALTPRESKFRLSNIECMLQGITTLSEKEGSYKLSAKLNKRGVVLSEGKFSLKNIYQKGTFSLQNIDLVALSGYLERASYLEVASGVLTSSGRTEYKKKSFKIVSDITLEQLQLNDTRDKKELLALQKVAISRVDIQESTARVKSISFDGFTLHADLNGRGNLNLSKLMKKQKDSNPKEEKEKKFLFNIDTFLVRKGAVNFRDDSLNEPFKLSLHNINATIDNITNRYGYMTKIALSNEIDKYAFATVDAVVSSADPKVKSDFQIEVEHYNMHSISPYSDTYAGEKIESGELFLKLDYSVREEQLLGKNNIIMKNTKLGKKRRDENSSRLPLDAVLLLLEDSNGVVDIDVAVDGDLGTPGFKYTSLFTKIVTDVITKVIYSPFSFIGSSLGMKSQSLEYIYFSFGKSEIEESQKKIVEDLAKILKEKASLSLKISGVYDVKKDLEALHIGVENREVLHQLAQSRARSVKEALIDAGVASKQIVIGADKEVKTGDDSYIKEHLQIVIK